ncbi:DNA mismatch endonuclease Vsr [Mesorhizobium sp. B2-7-3]|nr:very short patch repair endonuclease [Mesorhizobium sp. B2-7-3]TPJ13729.1 DNA mismatch endonuclease Vsr [Mesorhizobium sp. B2-7-3]
MTGRRRAVRPDPLSPEQRRHNMAQIGSRDSKPEMVLRRALHRAGLRYRLHVRGMRGTPDLVFTRCRATLFVHGCFWHAHICPLGITPATNAEFWVKKLERNVERDASSTAELLRQGWRVAIVWECSLKGRARRQLDEVVAEITRWLNSDEPELEIAGNWEGWPTGVRNSFV